MRTMVASRCFGEWATLLTRRVDEEAGLLVKPCAGDGKWERSTGKSLVTQRSSEEWHRFVGNMLGMRSKNPFLRRNSTHSFTQVIIYIKYLTSIPLIGILLHTCAHANMCGHEDKALAFKKPTIQ